MYCYIWNLTWDLSLKLSFHDKSCFIGLSSGQRNGRDLDWFKQYIMVNCPRVVTYFINPPCAFDSKQTELCLKVKLESLGQLVHTSDRDVLYYIKIAISFFHWFRRMVGLTEQYDKLVYFLIYICLFRVRLSFFPCRKLFIWWKNIFALSSTHLI